MLGGSAPPPSLGLLNPDPAFRQTRSPRFPPCIVSLLPAVTCPHNAHLEPWISLPKARCTSPFP